MALTAGDPLWYYKVLGLHCDGANNSTTFTDVKGKTVTANGNAKISTAQYPSLTGKSSSGYVDGTGDYLTVPDSADWDFGTGDFGVRITARFSGVSTLQALISNYQNSTTGFSMVFDGVNSKLQFLNGTTALLDVAWSPSANTWYVIEVSRSGTSLRGFVDGTQVGSTATNSTSITGSTSTLFVGARDASNQLLTGYFSEVEVYKGAPLNTANYTPSSDTFPDTYVRISGTTQDMDGYFTPHLVRVYRRDTGALVGQVVSDETTGEYAVTAADSGKTTPIKHVAYMHTTETGIHVPFRVLGLHCDGANTSTTFTDVHGKAVTANGNAQISTAQYPSLTGKTSSGYLDGTGDYLSIPDSADWDFGTGNFAIRMRVRFSSHTTVQSIISNYLNGTTGFVLQRRSDNNTITFGCAGDPAHLAVSWTPTDNVWYVIEVCRVGTSLFARVDGTQVGSSATNSTNITGSTNALLIGSLFSVSYIQPFHGYISEVEVYKGSVPNTADYTPSGDPFTDALGDATDNALIYDDLTPY